jgi:predicted small metal-binding protein
MSDKRLRDDVPAAEINPSVQPSRGEANSAPPLTWAGTHGDRTLNCSDCEWKVSGNTEEEVLGYMRAHARQVHAKSEFTPAELESARRSIHKHNRAA